ncbi:MAG: hypothetical protein AAF581_12400 [Planctomycetota bacterium]
MHAGAAVVDITPDRDLWLAGFDTARRSDGVHDPLSVRALVVTRGFFRITLVALDLIGIQRQELLPIFEELGYPAGHAIIACTHTHSSPDTLGLWGRPPFVGGVDGEYFARVKDAIIQAVREAERNLQPAEMATTSIIVNASGIGRNLRRPGIEDRDCVIVHFRATARDEQNTQATIATLVEFGCHPEVIGSSHAQVSADYPHWLRKRIERSIGGAAIYVSGALGGLVSPEARSIPAAYEWHEVERIGVHLSRVALNAIHELDNYSSSGLLATWHAPLFLAQENTLYDIARWTGIIDRDLFGSGYLETEVNLWQLGPLSIASIPGEITPDLGLRIKEAMDGSSTMLIGLANDELGYLLPDLDYDLPIYRYERTLCVGRNAGELVTRRLELLARLARQQARAVRLQH